MMKQRNTFYCFSPPVMLASFLIEFVLAIYVFLRYSMTRFGKAAGFALVLLGTFQFAEYRICTTDGIIPVLWARLGFVVITLLPAVGLYLVSQLSHKLQFLKLAYLTAAGFVVYFAFVPKSISAAMCGGNYVIFNAANDFYYLYGAYYWGFLILGVWEGLERMANLKRTGKPRRVLRWLMIGYISFMAPMGAAYLLFPFTRTAVASIMCGFAVTLAVILAFKVVPGYNRAHQHRSAGVGI